MRWVAVGKGIRRFTPVAQYPLKPSLSLLLINAIGKSHQCRDQKAHGNRENI